MPNKPAAILAKAWEESMVSTRVGPRPGPDTGFAGIGRELRKV